MKFTMPDKPYDIIGLYDEVAMEMGYLRTEKLNYDCRCINVAANVQDNIYEWYIQNAKEVNPNANMTDVRTSITMILAINGPKVDINLEDNEVEVFKGFII